MIEIEKIYLSLGPVVSSLSSTFALSMWFYGCCSYSSFGALGFRESCIEGRKKNTPAFMHMAILAL